MKKALLTLFAASAILFSTPTPARADPVSAVLAIAGVISAKAAIISSISVAISLGASLLLKKKPRQIGQKLDIAIGGDLPLSFGAGLFATAGQLQYAGSWGQDGKTPNAYLTYVVLLSDAPIDGMSGLFVNGERATLAGAAAPQGTPVSQFNVGGKDHLWVKFYDGSQGAADPFLVSTFAGAHRPWTAEFVNRGRAYMILTMRYNREVFQSVPQFRFEGRGIRVYDPREDTTAGGDGPQREDNPAAWTWTDNATLISRQLLRGVRVAGSWGEEWLYGGQTIAAARLPHDAWIAAANEGFKAGGEIECDIEPLDALDRLTAATGGRLAEIGGVYKPRPADAAAAVYAFTDDAVIVTDPQQFDPFETLARRVNKIEASYPEPIEAWTPKPAPARLDEAAVARDKGRELTDGLDMMLVPYGAQVQQLMQIALNEAQRQRRHRFRLPPIAWLLEPGDTVAWTSARNGYDAKLFRVEEMAGGSSFVQEIALREIEPEDYDWSSEDEIDVDHHPIVIDRPPAQSMTGFQVFPASYEDDAGQGYPSIEIRFDADLDDVRAIRVQVRLASDASLVFDGEVPYELDGPGRIVLNAVFLPATDYEVRARYISFSARATSWSAWLPVTTPDTRFIAGVPPHSVDLDKLDQDARDLVAHLSDRARDLERQARDLHSYVTQMQADDFLDRQLLRTRIEATAGNLRADYTSQIFSVVTATGALAGRIEIVETAQVDPETGNAALAGALDALTVRTEDVEDGLVLQGDAVTALSLAYTDAETGNLALADALDTVSLRIDVAEDDISLMGDRVDLLEVAYADPDTGNAALASALAAQAVEIEDIDGALAAQANALLAAQAQIAGDAASLLVVNPFFAAGAEGWTADGDWQIVEGGPTLGPSAWSARAISEVASSTLRNTGGRFPTAPGERVYAQCMVWRAPGAVNGARAIIRWLDAAGGVISVAFGNHVNAGVETWLQSRVVGTAPAGAAYGQVEGQAVNLNGEVYASGFAAARMPRGDDLPAVGAAAGAHLNLGAQVDANYDALADAIIGVNAASGDNVANAGVGFQAQAASAGAAASFAMRVAASGGGAMSEAVFRASVASGGESWLELIAGKTFIRTPDGTILGLFDAETGTAFFDRARIRNLIADNWDFNAGISMGGTGATDEVSTTSGSFANMPSMSGVTRVVDADGVMLCLAQCTFWAGSGGGAVSAVLNTTHSSQGSRTIGSGAMMHASFEDGSRPMSVMGFGMIDCLAGTHTFNLQWRRDNGSNPVFTSHRRLGLIFFKKATFSGLFGSSSQSGGGSGSGGGGWDDLP